MTKRHFKYGQTHRTVKGRKQKYCTKCKRWKGETEFGKDRAKRDGLKIPCRDCDKAYGRRRRRKSRKTVRRYLRYEQRHRVVDGVEQKLCTRCSKWKDRRQFYKNSRSKDRFELQCKECKLRYARKQYEQKRAGAGRYIRREDRHRIVNRIKQKLCSNCRKWKKESEFYRNRSHKDGLDYQCKKCSYKVADKSREK